MESFRKNLKEKISFGEIKEKILSGEYDPTIKFSKGYTLLHIMAECVINGMVRKNRYPEIIDFTLFLLKNTDLDINERDDNKNTPLHISCSIGSLKIVRVLMEDDRIKPNLRDNDGKTPLDLSIQSCLGTAAFLIKNKKIKLNKTDPFALYALCDAGQLGLVQYIVEDRREDIDIEQKYRGISSLNRCFLNGEMSIAKYLLEQGAKYDYIIEGNYVKRTDRCDVETLEILLLEIADGKD